MSEEYVNKEEFKNLEKKVTDLEEKVGSTIDILAKINAKIDVINEKLDNAREVNDLKNHSIEDRINTKISPLQSQVITNSHEIDKIREDKNKMFWTLVGEAIAIIATIIGLFLKK